MKENLGTAKCESVPTVNLTSLSNEAVMGWNLMEVILSNHFSWLTFKRQQQALFECCCCQNATFRRKIELLLHELFGILIDYQQMIYCKSKKPLTAISDQCLRGIIIVMDV